MNFIAINLTLIEAIVFPIAVTIFGLAVYFFIKTRKTLRETLEENKRIYSPNLLKEKATSHRRSDLDLLEEQFAKKRHEAFKEKEALPLPVKKQKPTHANENMVQDLKSTIAQQQQLLNSYLFKVEALENEGKEELQARNDELLDKIDHLEEIIEKKEADLESLQQQTAAAQKMASRIEEVYAEFEQFQAKMGLLEKQANRANNLAIELEDTKGAFEALHKELARKQERLEEVMEENQSMREEMNLLEDKLSEANFQRQQLQKKVQFLTDLNSDMQNISDTNKKLQTELRRIGELESMLNMMSEERDFLLKKKRTL
jgi:chromosome segregation ATPase